MRLLLDESVPVRLRRSRPDHEVKTVVEMGWSGVKNGELLKLASAGFDVFITVDKNLPYQQNLSILPLAVIVLDTASNNLQMLLPLFPDLNEALRSLQPKSYVRVGISA